MTSKEKCLDLIDDVRCTINCEYIHDSILREINEYLDGIEKFINQSTSNPIKDIEKYWKLEEELGCPLEVFVKMFFLGVVVKDDNYEANGFSEWPGDEIIINTHTKEFSIYCIGTWKLSDYQKTWWLKGEKNE